MESLWALVTSNPATFLVGLIVVIAIVIFMYNNRKGLLYKAALYAVTKAEEQWGSDTGKIKFADVYTYISKQFPIVTFFFTQKQLTKIIEDALLEMKRILASKQSKTNAEK